eukprot:2883289-Rhodomonas_salina.1
MSGTEIACAAYAAQRLCPRSRYDPTRIAIRIFLLCTLPPYEFGGHVPTRSIICSCPLCTYTEPTVVLTSGMLVQVGLQDPKHAEGGGGGGGRTEAMVYCVVVLGTVKRYRPTHSLRRGGTDGGCAGTRIVESYNEQPLSKITFPTAEALTCVTSVSCLM